MAQKLLLIALAGAAGTLARYGLGGLVYRWLSPSFPWGTAVVNITGCFLFGLVWAAGDRWSIAPETRTVLLVGFMGAFTTFSTLIHESGQMFLTAQPLAACGNLAVNTLAGTGVFFLGLALGRLL